MLMSNQRCQCHIVSLFSTFLDIYVFGKCKEFDFLNPSQWYNSIKK